jgi:hypothetical protein
MPASVRLLSPEPRLVRRVVIVAGTASSGQRDDAGNGVAAGDQGLPRRGRDSDDPPGKPLLSGRVGIGGSFSEQFTAHDRCHDPRSARW